MKYIVKARKKKTNNHYQICSFLPKENDRNYEGWFCFDSYHEYKYCLSYIDTKSFILRCINHITDSNFEYKITILED